MSVARRPLLTATAAGTLLCALWFVPSAKAAEEHSGPEQQPVAAGQSFTSARLNTTSEDPNTSQPLALADTGSVSTTPYLIGGTAFLGIGAGFVAYAARRSAGLI
ncbi:hypothetical protein [Streptomyces sp. NPDC088261]|uniref:hypothetical protein n=1 Tax=Streptomyces sp. NPDC088261 TaxID=3365851 RepID=UPI003807E4DB